MTTTVGYTIGRFNPYQKGHRALLQHVYDNNDRMVVLIGSAAESRTHKNPLTYDERRQLVLADFPDAVVMPLPDMPVDAEWIRLMTSTVSVAIASLGLQGEVQPRLYSADASRADDYALRCSWVAHLGHEVVPFEPVRASTDLSATLVRDHWYHSRYEELSALVPDATLELMQRLDLGWMRSHYVKKLPIGERGDLNAVCVAFVSDPAFLYREDPACQAWEGDAWNTQLAMLGYAMRWNGELGFVGGRVRGDEDLLVALQREARHEVATELEADRLAPVCTHAMTGKGPLQHVHLYLYRLSAEELFGLRRRSLDARHARTELSAFAVTHMTTEAPDILLQQQWSGTAKEQLKTLLWSGHVPSPQVVA